jgi:hypothetical protein
VTRAKFRCCSYTVSEYGTEYHFNAVSASDIPEDASFWKYTANGNLSMTVTNPNVTFDLGKSYYLDFTLAAEEATS